MTDQQRIVSRRSVLTGLGCAGSILVTGCTASEPPTYGNVLRMADNLTYRTQRLLLPTHALAREYTRGDISAIPAIGTTNPSDPKQAGSEQNAARYEGLRRREFADWRLQVEGSVARPASFSLTDLKSFPERTQITKHTCEEGWSAIAEWTGVPLSQVLTACGILPQARFVNFFAFDDTSDSIDMFDALHPQTLLAYGMNGRDLPIAHGAPLRLRVERQLGMKMLKFLHRIVVTDHFFDPGEQGPLAIGWAWYFGI